jgi:squalene monooxygenase
MERADVVIVGGGFAGTAAAAALADGRRRIVVLEARTGADPRFRGELIHPPGVRILGELGLLAPLQAAGAAPVEGFATMIDRDRPAVLLRYAEVAGGGPSGLAISHQDMVARLRREVIARPGVDFRTGQRVTDVVREGSRVAGVRTAAGLEVRADLTVVAEGRHSKLRGQLGFGEEAELLSFTAALLAEDAELPHPGYGHVFLGAHGPILAYPIGGGRVRMCIDVPIAAGKGQEAVRAFLEGECAPWVPEPLRGAMIRSLGREAPELCANHAICTYTCTAPGVALVGDSGGCSHPLTATGMTIALNDLRVLAEELAGGGSVPHALARYERRRYEFARAREIVAQGLYDVFRGGDPGARAMRRGIFRYWESGPRARAASVALLSGHESRLRAFVAEYVSVLGYSTRSVLAGEASDPSLRATAAGLWHKAEVQLERTARLVYEGVRRRLWSQTAAAPAPIAAPPASERRPVASTSAPVRLATDDPASADPTRRVTTPRTSGLL